VTIIQSLVGVYHADGGLRGELAYVVGKLRGTVHCGLCDITHRGVRPKPVWTAFTESLGVPFEVVHLNERSAAVAAASDGRTPCVLAHTESGLRLLLGPDELDSVGGDLDRFASTLRAAIADAGLSLPAV
jgi:hypothetical protein